MQTAEYDVICQNLVYDPEKQSWSTKYPFIIDPSVLRNNLNQALACMRSLEKRLMKQKKLQEFNIAFQEIVERGVFRELSAKELALWKGPVNYILTAYKNGPHQTTPLRI